MKPLFYIQPVLRFIIIILQLITLRLSKGNIQNVLKIIFDIVSTKYNL